MLVRINDRQRGKNSDKMCTDVKMEIKKIQKCFKVPQKYMLNLIKTIPISVMFLK